MTNITEFETIFVQLHVWFVNETILIVQDIVRFQDRQFAKDPVKAKAKKRYVAGLREIKKFLQVKKITLLILAPDVEPVKIKGDAENLKPKIESF